MNNSNTVEQLIQYFKFQNRLKNVLRNNWDQNSRKESSAEHSWSVAMMVWLLAGNVENELNIKLDQNKILKMSLIHDIVEIEAGDVAAWDNQGREDVKSGEEQAIKNILEHLPSPAGQEIHDLWVEHEDRQTTEAKLVKACDQICPLIYRLTYHCTYEGTGVDRAKLDSIFLDIVNFSQTTKDLYQALATELETQGFFDNKG